MDIGGLRKRLVFIDGRPLISSYDDIHTMLAFGGLRRSISVGPSSYLHGHRQPNAPHLQAGHFASSALSASPRRATPTSPYTHTPGVGPL